MAKLLEVKNLVTSFRTDNGSVRVLDHVNFHINKGETLGIVGESGCGKSVTSLSIMRLLPKPAGQIEKGEVILDDIDLTKLKADEMHNVRGNKISMIFQEPMTALNPIQKIGRQLAECYELHFPNLSKDEIKQKSIDLLESVGIPAAEKRLNEFSGQLSGGLRQRVMIAMALACEPELLIADEPTTALDVTIQAQILKLIKKMQKKSGMAVMFITHDLGVVAGLCDRVAVMYAGRVVEVADVYELFRNPKHPYTKGLIASIPKLDHPSKEKLETIEGMVPDLMSLPVGCNFQNRCKFVSDICKEDKSNLEDIGNSHFVSCHNKDQVS